MPLFRTFWGWAAFTVLVVVSLAAVVATTEGDGLWDFAINVGHRVEPLWIGSAILVYTVMEGVAMLAEAFLRKRFEQGEAKGRAEGIVEGEARGEARGEAKGKAEGRAETLSAVRQAAELQGLKPEVIQGMIDKTREVVRNGESPNGRA